MTLLRSPRSVHRALDEALTEAASVVQTEDGPGYDWRRGRATYEARGAGVVRGASWSDRDRDPARPTATDRRFPDRAGRPSPREPCVEPHQSLGGGGLLLSGGRSAVDGTPWPVVAVAVSPAPRAPVRGPPSVRSARTSGAAGGGGGTPSGGGRRGYRVATASLDGGVRVWDAETGRLLGTCRGGGGNRDSSNDDDNGGDDGGGGGSERKKRMTSDAASPSFRRASDVWWGSPSLLAAAFTDGHVRAWRLEDAAGIDADEGADAKRTRGDVDGEHADEDAEAEATSSGVLSPSSARLVYHLEGHAGRVTSACFDSPALLCTASVDKTARLWSLGAAGEERDHDGRSLIVGSVPHRALTGGHDASLTCVALSSPRVDGGRLVATGDARGTFCVWSLPLGRLLFKVTWGAGGEDGITSCLFLPRGPGEGDEEEDDGCRLATAHYYPETNRSRVLMWRVPRAGERSRAGTTTPGSAHLRSAEEGLMSLRGYCGELPGPGRTFEGRVTDLDVAHSTRPTLPPSGKKGFARGGQDGGGGGDDSNSDRSDAGGSFDESDGSSEGDDVLSGSGVLLASGTGGWIAAADASTFTPLYTLEGEHPCRGARVKEGPAAVTSWSVHRCRASPASGRMFATAGEDGTVKVWATEDGTSLASFRGGGGPERNGGGGGKVWAAAWSDDESFLVSGAADGTAVVRDVDVRPL